MLSNKTNPIIGVYKITNAENGMVYIGYSIQTNVAWSEYIRELINRCHPNEVLQHHFLAHGIDKFSFTILELVDNNTSQDDFMKLKQAYIQKYNSTNPKLGYNHPNELHGTRSMWAIRNKLYNNGIIDDSIKRDEYYNYLSKCGLIFKDGTDGKKYLISQLALDTGYMKYGEQRTNIKTNETYSPIIVTEVGEEFITKIFDEYSTRG